MNFRQAIGAALCAFVFLFNQPIVAFAQDAAPVVQTATSSTAGQLVGFDGKTTWAGQVVRLVDASTGKLVAEVTTGQQGQFTLPELAPGTYLVSVGQIVTRFTITAEKPVRQLRLVVSAEQLRGEQIPLADLNRVADEGGTNMILILGTVLLIGAGAAGGLVAGYNLRHTTGDGDTTIINNNPVSPFQP